MDTAEEVSGLDGEARTHFGLIELPYATARLDDLDAEVTDCEQCDVAVDA